MISSRCFAAAVLLGILGLLFGRPAVCSAEEEWPEGWEIREGSESPNGRYGLLTPTWEEAQSLNEDTVKTTLVDLKTHRRLAVIRDIHFSPARNHSSLKVWWAADSSWCVVDHEGRYGFAKIVAVEIREGKYPQISLGEHLQKQLNAAIAAQAGPKSWGCYGIAYFHSGPRRKMLIRAVGYTNPKGLAEVGTYHALLAGTYDLAAGRWARSEVRKISSEDNEPLDFAYADYFDEENSFNTEEARLQWYDERLNEVYAAVRVVLPAERFAAVKKEQIAWLPKLEAQPTINAKCNLMRTRIEELRRLMW